MQLSFVTSELVSHMSYQALVQLFLIFSNPFLLGAVAIIGLVSDRRNFAPATMLLIFSMILNPFLKSLFMVPLPSDVSPDGYAFPSGHALAVIVFYGWFFWSYRNNLTKFCMLFLMIGVSWALIAAGYHNIFDIIAAWLIGSLVILSYSYLLRNQKIIVAKIAKSRPHYERLLRGETIPSCVLLLISLALLASLGWFYTIKLKSYAAIVLIPLLATLNYYRSANKRELSRGASGSRDESSGEVEERDERRDDRRDDRRGERRDDRRGERRGGERRDDRRGERRDDRRPQ